MEPLLAIFGTGKDLGVVQMAARAVVVFILTLLAVRIAGRRSFGQRTPFDQVIAILLGAVASRAIVGASAFVPTMAACFTLVILHRLLALASVFFPRIDALVNGAERIVIREGRTDPVQMRKALLTPRDLQETARLNGREELGEGCKLVLERSGEISYIEKHRP